VASSSIDRFNEWLQEQKESIPIKLYFAWMIAKHRFNLIFASNKLMALQFRVWIEHNLPADSPLRKWIMELPDQALQELTKSAANYCANLNIQLTWLLGKELEVAPAIKESIKLILLEFLEGCFKAVHHKEEINIFSVYCLLTAPDKYGQRIDLRRSVFKQVSALGLCEPIPAYDLIMSSELERQSIAATALREAASKDWDAFSKALSKVLATNEQPST
jgi:hypothetical protein